MHSLALLALLLAADPAASQATQLASKQDWDQLYLSFSSVKPDGYSASDRAAISAALLKGAHGMASSDAVLATSLAERAVVFHESVDTLVAAAELEEKVEQAGQAAKFLDRAVALEPKSGAAHLARAALHLQEGEGALALKQLDAVPAGYEAKKVKQLRTQAEAKVAEHKAGEAALEQVQKQVNGGGAAPAQPAQRGGKAKVVQVEQASAVDPVEGAALAGLRERAGQHFNFAYGNNSRDWGQRAEYEGNVEAALEEAYEFVGESMHTNRTQPVSVVLYTKQEYDFHFGGSSLSRAAGFFSGKIRINGAEEMTPEVKAVIVHEYVHAVLDELLHGGQHCPVWVNEGFATYIENLYRERRGMPGADDAHALHGYAVAGALPKLADLDHSFIDYPNPRLAYATAGEAMKLLVERYGMETFTQTCRDAATHPWKQLFSERFTPDLSSLDDQVRSELAE